MPPTQTRDLPPLVDLDLRMRPVDIQPQLLALGREHDVVRVRHAGGEPWVVCAPHLVARAFLDERLSKDPRWRPEWFVDVFGLVGGAQIGDVPVIITSEGEVHRRMRRLHTAVFGPRHVPRWQEFVQDELDALWDACARREGAVDLVADLAHPLPVRVIGAVLGLPRDLQDRAARACHAISLGPDDAARVQGQRDLFGGVDELVHRRRAEVRDGMIADLLAMAERDGSFGPREVVVWTAGLFLPGHESTASLIGSMLWEVLRLPAAQRPGADDVDGVVEGMLRLHPPFPLATWRFTTTDVPLGDAVAPARTPVLLNLPAANAGAPAGRHLSFGHGIHLCVGAALARLEARVVLSSFLTRFPRAELADAEPTWISGEALRRVAALPVHLDGRRS